MYLVQVVAVGAVISGSSDSTAGLECFEEQGTVVSCLTLYLEYSVLGMFLPANSDNYVCIAHLRDSAIVKSVAVGVIWVYIYDTSHATGEFAS